MASEKEVNVYLFDQLDLAEDALELAKKEGAKETIAFLEKQIKRINRKLYQKPPLMQE